jgi:ABC-2 type transport system permease protein
MILQAFGFYTYHTWKNALLARFRRLRQPKYLVGAIVGLLYFYFVVFARRKRTSSTHAWIPSFDTVQMMHVGAAILVFVLFLLTWIFPRERAALIFTEAEIAFLFPAPIGRRTLINFKLLRTQLMILLSAILFTIFGRTWAGSNPFIRIIGWWIVLSTMSLHSLGASFAVTGLSERGVGKWTRRLVVVLLIVGAVVGVAYYTWLSAPPFPQDGDGLKALQKYVIDLADTTPMYYLLWPFRVLLAPFFATNWYDFATAFPAALAIFALHYWWVITANVSFEEASIELSRKTAERIAAMRSGNFGGARPKKAKRNPFELGTEGSPAMAIFWKNLISTGQIFSRRFWFTVLWLIFVCAFTMRSHFGWSATLAMASGMFAIMSLFFGPQIMRQDFRQDLPMVDVLKTFPMRGWQVVLGEILTPAAILAFVQWILIAVFLIGSPAQFERQNLPLAMKLSCCLGAAIVIPFLDLIAILLLNTGTLLLPAWFQFDKSTPRGIETMGQQLILVFGQILALAICLIPAAIAFAIVLFLAHYVVGMGVGIVLGSIAAAAMMCVEIAIAVRLLGNVFERFDLSLELGNQ